MLSLCLWYNEQLQYNSFKFPYFDIKKGLFQIKHFIVSIE